MKTGDITLNWSCEPCHTQSVQPLWDITEVGTAVCEVCGDDMALEDHVAVNPDSQVMTALRDCHEVMDAAARQLNDGGHIDPDELDATSRQLVAYAEKARAAVGEHDVESKPARVLIQVMGGVADYLADGDVDVELIDYDNDPDPPTPERFMDLCPEKFAGRNPPSVRPVDNTKGGARWDTHTTGIDRSSWTLKHSGRL